MPVLNSFRSTAHSTFRSLHVRNYRLYFAGQIVSVSGTWMQSVAQAWLVLELAPSSQKGIDLGIVTALQFLPMLLFGTWGGLIADRADKRRLLYATQTSASVLALALGLLVGIGHGPHETGSARLWQVDVLATLLGFVNLFDNPARQTFVLEMVERDDLPNAVSLNSVVMNAARMVGPAIGGVLISTTGLAVCFYSNAASYLAVILGLALMRADELHRSAPVRRAKGQLRAGVRYVWGTPALRGPLLLVAVVGTLAYNFQVVLALLAKLTFHGGAGVFSALTSLMAAGAVGGGLAVASRGRPTIRRLTMLCAAFGVLMIAVAVSPTLAVALVMVVPMGAASIAFIATTNSTLQMQADPTMRGRVMALYAIAFLGTTPIGSLLVGWISQVWSPRTALVVGGVAAMASAAVLYRVHRRDEAGRPAGPPAAVDGTEPGTELGTV